MASGSSGDHVTFAGHFVDGRFAHYFQWEGTGELVSPCGTRIAGSFRNARWAPGEGTGTITVPQGHAFRGKIFAGRPHGEGDVLLADGRTLHGRVTEQGFTLQSLQWPCGTHLMCGYRPKAALSGTISGTGSLNGDLAWSGPAKLRWGDEISYVGMLHDDCLHGHGFMRWLDGQTFSGEWLGDRMFRGVLAAPPRSPWAGWAYDGPLHGGLPHGHGTARRRHDGAQIRTDWQGGRPADRALGAMGPWVPTAVPSTAPLHLDRSVPQITWPTFG